MSPNSISPTEYDFMNRLTLRRNRKVKAPLVLIVEDNESTCVEMRQTLELRGYRVIYSDNGLDAAKQAQYMHPDVVVVDLDVPLLYELVAARQILKQAQIGSVPIVLVTHAEEADPYPMMEIGVRRNEYVTRLSDKWQLEHLLEFLLPVVPDSA